MENTTNNNGVQNNTTEVKVPGDPGYISYKVGLVENAKDLFGPIKQIIPEYTGKSEDRRKFYAAAYDRMFEYLGCKKSTNYGRHSEYLSFLQNEVQKDNNTKERIEQLQTAYHALTCVSHHNKKRISTWYPELYKFIQENKVHKNNGSHKKFLRPKRKKKKMLQQKREKGITFHLSEHTEKEFNQQLEAEKRFKNEQQLKQICNIFKPNINNQENLDEENNEQLNNYFNDNNNINQGQILNLNNNNLSFFDFLNK